MSERCPSTRLSGAHCTLEVGHPGAHLEVADNGVTGWPQADPAPTWQPAPSPTESGEKR